MIVLFSVSSLNKINDRFKKGKFKRRKEDLVPFWQGLSNYDPHPPPGHLAYTLNKLLMMHTKQKGTKTGDKVYPKPSQQGERRQI